MDGLTDAAAEQIVKMTLDGVEVAFRITGAAAKQTALILLAALKNPDNKKIKGKAQINTMLRQGKPTTLFAIKPEDLKTFAAQAKRYGILYAVIRKKGDKTSPVDIIARIEDAPRIKRIIENWKLGAIKQDVEISPPIPVNKEQTEEKASEGEPSATVKTAGERAAEEASHKKEPRTAENPSAPQTEKEEHPSGQNYGIIFSGREQSDEKQTKASPETKKPSVRKKLAHFRNDVVKLKQQRVPAEITHTKKSPEAMRTNSKARRHKVRVKTR